ncbi:RluA family pseudouridine synthase [Wenyingzhuangia aestuarii]|uniref:RluA family pseudouridine synthase n=1 Tax=Wenyingzhuangia aestuarii TaxID=1647582 RepID=UPI00143BE8F7|nr:RluA family pseudouridine synthase [Wenyingzhuangia aestuarii]NJB81491.1 23S rRNA pseudouridine1911/1915/1917 synthase [Wenyingzhuangia aestuarii]
MHSTKQNLQVLFEDNHIIVINKRSGDITQGDKTGDKPLSDVVKEYIKDKENKPGNVYLGVVHRLDRPTSGIVIFAKTSKALERLNKALRDKKIHKTYWAVVNKIDILAKQTLSHHLVKNPKNNKSIICKATTQGAKHAILHYHIVKKLDNFQLLEIELETGRHHQIRVQLSSLGCTIKGDLKYGAKRSNKDGSIHLHARRIEFIHPVKKELVTIIAPVPDDAIWKACEA